MHAGDIIISASKEDSMARALRRLATILFLFGLAVVPAFSQSDAAAAPFGVKMELGIGVQNFTGLVEPGTFQSLGLTPDISFGKFGIGMAVVLNYQFKDGALYIRKADWVPDPITVQSLAGLYLPKFRYVRWGERGDPLFVKFGSFNDGTLGDGFIMGEYDNSLFLPSDRHFGLQAGLDGSLFSFPFVGFESLVGNIAAFDVLGVRVYVRPLVATQIPILNNLEVGLLGAVDTNPYFGTRSTGATSPIAAFGGDVRLPIVYVKDVVSLVAFTDVASIGGKSWGGMLGVGGKLINFLTYGAQLRVLGENFIPVYFGPTYDLFRDQQYNIVTSQSPVPFAPALVGWQASMGTSFLEDKIIFRISVDGPFGAPATTDPVAALLSYPHLRGVLSLAEGVVPGITFDFTYDKKAIQSFGDLISPKDAAIKAQLNFKTGGAVISFVYNIVYNPPPAAEEWTVTSGLQSSISLF
jgi:hypothetical protein